MKMFHSKTRSDSQDFKNPWVFYVFVPFILNHEAISKYIKFWSQNKAKMRDSWNIWMSKLIKYNKKVFSSFILTI